MENGSVRPAAVVPAKSSPSAYACIRSLHQHGVRTIVPWAYDDVPAVHSRYCDESVRVPSPHDDLVAYRDALLALARRPTVRTILPVFEEDAYLLSKYRERFSEYVTLAVPTLDQLERVQDRVRLVETAADAGVPAPETSTLSETDDWTGSQIVKSRYNLLTPDQFDSYDDAETHLVKHLSYLEAGEPPNESVTVAEMRHEPIVQDVVPGNGQYVFGALYDHGEPVSTFQHRQIRGETYAGGGGSYRETVAIPELERVGRRLLDELDWHGLACIEYIRDERTGEFVLLELNPRTWRSISLPLDAGVDFPRDYWRLVHDQPPDEPSTYELDYGMHFLHGEWTYLRSVLFEDYENVERPSVLGTVRDIVASTVEQPHFDYLRLSDPGPFAFGMLEALR